MKCETHFHFHLSYFTQHHPYLQDTLLEKSITHIRETLQSPDYIIISFSNKLFQDGYASSVAEHKVTNLFSPAYAGT